MNNSKEILRKNCDKEYKLYQAIQRYSSSEFLPKFCSYYSCFECNLVLEGFWSQLKRSINGTYHFVSPKHLQTYVNEFAYRYNRRKAATPIFLSLVEKVALPL